MSSPFRRGRRAATEEAEQETLIEQNQPAPAEAEVPRISPRVNIVEPSDLVPPTSAPAPKAQVPLLPLANDQLRPNNVENVVQPPADQSGDNDPSGHSSASVKPIQQDFQAAADRMKSLREFHQSCCFFWLHYPMRAFKLGYDVEDFLRYRSFEVTNKGLDLRRDTHGLCANLRIHELFTLKEHVIGLIKPVVRVHTVYLDSGMYIKSPDKPPCKPVYTSPHLSMNSGSKCIWNEDLSIEASYADIVSENTLVLIEILDTKASVYIEKEQQDKRMYMKRVAWGFLLPIGTYGQLNIAHSTKSSAKTPRHEEGAATARGAKSAPYKFPMKDVRIQLYRYREYDGIVGGIQRGILAWPSLNPPLIPSPPEEIAYPHHIPAVYLQYKLLRKKPIPGAYLSMSFGAKIYKRVGAGLGGLGGDGKGDGDDEDSSERSTSPSKPQVSAEDQVSLYERLSRHKKKKNKTKGEEYANRGSALRRVRRGEDACIVPHKFLRRLDVGPDGAMVTAFSHCGHLLAIACRFDTQSSPLYSQDYIYSIILYDPDSDEEVWADYVAHYGVIYQLSWSKNDRYLITCSGDGTAKVYDLYYFCPLIDIFQKLAGVGEANKPPEAGNLSPGLIEKSGDHGEANSNSPPASPKAPAAPAPPLFTQRAHILKTCPPRAIHVMSVGGANYCYCCALQDFNPPLVLQALRIYGNGGGVGLMGMDGESGSGMFLTHLQDTLQTIHNALVPRCIVGCADGSLRVFDSGVFTGYITVRIGESTGAGEGEGGEDISPHESQVNSIIIDERTRYLISGDGRGEVYAWRLNK
eukprot:gene28670-34614_t